MKRLYVNVPAAVLLLLIAWRLNVQRRDAAAQQRAASARKHAAATVQVAPAVTRDIVHEFQGIGNVESPLDVRLAAKVAGRLDYLQVREGAFVWRGEVLARIDPSEVQAAVNQQEALVGSARANLADAQVRYRRTVSLYKQRFIAAQDLDDARTAVEVQKGALNAAEAQLRNVEAQRADTILRSPINGFVTARYIDPGSVIGAGQTIVDIQAIRRVYTTTSVPEGGERSVHAGMRATADFDALPGCVFAGKVTQVSPAADLQSRQFLVRVMLDNPRGLIKPGMYGRVSVITQVTHNATVVPHEALDATHSPPIVVVVDAASRAHNRVVQAGDQDPAGVEIKQGVLPGEKVVILSAQPLREGQTVRIDRGVPPTQLAGVPDIIRGGGGGMTAPSPATGGGGAPSYGTLGTPVSPPPSPAAPTAGTAAPPAVTTAPAPATSISQPTTAPTVIPGSSGPSTAGAR